MADEIRREGAKAERLEYAANNTEQKRSGQDGPGVDGSVEGVRVREPTLSGGYVGDVPELERNDDTRHPSTKTWVRRDRKPNAYLHSGNG